MRTIFNLEYGISGNDGNARMERLTTNLFADSVTFSNCTKKNRHLKETHPIGIYRCDAEIIVYD